jgi:putative hydrolases of HD superfamily
MISRSKRAHSMNEEETKNVVKLIHEAGQLKRVKRSGWWIAGITTPESVAEHVSRTLLVGYVLARAENANVEKVLLMLTSHDLPETRINDMHKIAVRYLEKKLGEKQALQDQTKNLPKSLQMEFVSVWEEFEDAKTIEAIVSHDADLLECAFQAKEYMDVGVSAAEDWIRRIRERLTTKTARQLLATLEKGSSNDWWQGLKTTNDTPRKTRQVPDSIN